MTVRRHLSKWREVFETTFPYYLWCLHQRKPGAGENHREIGCAPGFHFLESGVECRLSQWSLCGQWFQ